MREKKIQFEYLLTEEQTSRVDREMLLIKETGG